MLTKLNGDAEEIFERRRAVGNKAVERYLPRFKEHVKGLKFKTSMKDAISDRYESMGSFYKRTRSQQGLDEAIEQRLKDNPGNALRRPNIADDEIAAELQAIAEADAALKRFIDEIPKYPLPKIDDRWPKFP